MLKPISTKFVSLVPNGDHQYILREHFNLLFTILSETQLIPNATFQRVQDIQRCLSGIPAPYYNAVLGCPVKDSWDARIEEQLSYFKKADMPFVWYLDEESSPEFKEKLLDCGFQAGGIFRGVIGALDKPIPNPEIPDDCVVERVDDESAMEEFNELVCGTFGIQGASKELFKKVLWKAKKNTEHPMFHWIARKEGKVVSVLSTLIEKDIVIFWNGASLPEVHRQGLSTALRRLALREAISKGCPPWGFIFDV